MHLHIEWILALKLRTVNFLTLCRMRREGGVGGSRMRTALQQFYRLYRLLVSIMDRLAKAYTGPDNNDPAGLSHPIAYR